MRRMQESRKFACNSEEAQRRSGTRDRSTTGQCWEAIARMRCRGFLCFLFEIEIEISKE